MEYRIRPIMIIKIAHSEAHKPNDSGNSRGEQFKGIPDIFKTEPNIVDQS